MAGWLDSHIQVCLYDLSERHLEWTSIKIQCQFPFKQFYAKASQQTDPFSQRNRNKPPCARKWGVQMPQILFVAVRAIVNDRHPASTCNEFGSRSSVVWVGYISDGLVWCCKICGQAKYRELNRRHWATKRSRDLSRSGGPKRVTRLLKSRKESRPDASVARCVPLHLLSPSGLDRPPLGRDNYGMLSTRHCPGRRSQRVLPTTDT